MSVVFFNTADAEVESDSNTGGIVTTNSQGQSEAQVALTNFWTKITDDIRKIRTLDLKNQALPLARIKKIMKLDDDVKMISAEAPMLFAKAAEIFIHELTLRAWIHTEDNKRRTLQRNDIAMAITKFDQFDFLIDIVPRDEIKPNKSRDDPSSRTSMNADQVHYYFQLAQQHQAALQQTSTQQAPAVPQAAAAVPTIQIVQPATGQVQTVSVAAPAVEQVPASTVATATVATASAATTQAGSTQQQQQQQQQQATAQVIQLQQPSQASATSAAQQGGIQIVQQIVTPTGEIQQIPIHLTPSQLQLIRMQVQSGSGQPIIIQTAPIQAIQQTAAQPQIIQAVSLSAEDPLSAPANSQL